MHRLQCRRRRRRVPPPVPRLEARRRILAALRSPGAVLPSRPMPRQGQRTRHLPARTAAPTPHLACVSAAARTRMQTSTPRAPGARPVRHRRAARVRSRPARRASMRRHAAKCSRRASSSRCRPPSPTSSVRSSRSTPVSMCPRSSASSTPTRRPRTTVASSRCSPQTSRKVAPLAWSPLQTLRQLRRRRQLRTTPRCAHIRITTEKASGTSLRRHSRCATCGASATSCRPRRASPPDPRSPLYSYSPMQPTRHQRVREDAHLN
ncbi:hypothetical protein FA09DRAFT_229093 [Tilletiopsis washingtonensis]|uniref:Uncharacterized protein n=1 Tax=Tilletiopsis washingtonensis TaxID=58919 RepID=A0A316ZGF9_9BASI|nr:hypothetical protein FA09DRAFT_229093 [Tilletiopsis washingtonensis]PWN99373.1 hypothetical protein FA09DRAFT_229093 [Tilletiopsis washingtonensis]